MRIKDPDSSPETSPDDSPITQPTADSNIAAASTLASNKASQNTESVTEMLEAAAPPNQESQTKVQSKAEGRGRLADLLMGCCSEEETAGHPKNESDRTDNTHDHAPQVNQKDVDDVKTKPDDYKIPKTPDEPIEKSTPTPVGPVQAVHVNPSIKTHCATADPQTEATSSPGRYAAAASKGVVAGLQALYDDTKHGLPSRSAAALSPARAPPALGAWGAGPPRSTSTPSMQAGVRQGGAFSVTPTPPSAAAVARYANHSATGILPSTTPTPDAATAMLSRLNLTDSASAVPTAGTAEATARLVPAGTPTVDSKPTAAPSASFSYANVAASTHKSGTAPPPPVRATGAGDSAAKTARRAVMPEWMLRLKAELLAPVAAASPVPAATVTPARAANVAPSAINVESARAELPPVADVRQPAAAETEVTTPVSPNTPTGVEVGLEAPHPRAPDAVPSSVPHSADLDIDFRSAPEQATSTSASPLVELEAMDIDPIDDRLIHDELEPAIAAASADPGFELFHNDLLCQMEGTFRLLELYQEQGTGGLVEKILIDQENVVRLCNYARSGTALGIDKIDFAELDKAVAKIRGVYGDRERLARYLVELGVFPEQHLDALLHSNERDTTKPYMRAGLYFLVRPDNEALVFFWPVATTWSRDAAKNVSSNRVTFMRYLSQITDQLYCLISPEQLSELNFAEPEIEDDENSDSDEEEDTTFNFTVQRTNQQEEGVRLGDKDSRTMNIVIKPTSTIPIPNDLPADLRPRLVTGLKSIGIMTAQYCQGKSEKTRFGAESRTIHAMKKMLEHSNLALSLEMPLTNVKALLASGLLDDLVGAADHLETLKSRSSSVVENAHKVNVAKKMGEMDAQLPIFKAAARTFVVNELAERFPSFTSDLTLPSDATALLTDEARAIEWAAMETLFESSLVLADIEKPINDPRWQSGKIRFLETSHILHKNPNMKDSQRDTLVSRLVDAISSPTPDTIKEDAEKKKGPSMLSAFWSALGLSNSFDPVKAASQYEDDQKFLRRLAELVDTYPCMAEAATALRAVAIEPLLRHRDELIATAITHVHKKRTEKVKKVAADERQKHQLEEDGKCARAFVERANVMARRPPTGLPRPTILLYRFRPLTDFVKTNYVVTYDETRASPPEVKYQVRPMGMQETELQALAQEDSYNPQLDLRGGSGIEVCLEPHISIRARIAFSLSDTRRPSRTLEYVKVGSDCLPVVDLVRREIAVVSSRDRYRISEDGSACMRESETDLKDWYTSGTRFIQASFLAGQQELVLVDADDSGNKRLRIYSMISQQCRQVFSLRRPNTLMISPASMELADLDPKTLRSAADGSAFVSTCNAGGQLQLRAHMASSFGARPNGHPLDLFPSPSSDIAIFAPASASRMLLVYLDPEAETLRWSRLIITKENSERQLRAMSSGPLKKQTAGPSQCPLLGVFEEMWTRFPVVPAIERDALDDTIRQPRALTLVGPPGSDIKQPEFAGNWKRMVTEFKRKTKKPTKGLIDNIVLGVAHDIAPQDLVSSFRFGQFLVAVFCLIPLHLAVAKDKRFIPFTQGKDDIQWERGLLGADVNSVASSISLGWYEAILGRYYRNTPVRVISSLGNQSVGKSYMLNHIAGTSFAGAAGRTTEGVWMAVAPAKDCIYVLLDFEGVNSPERHPQEDMLLVLFNAALSNFVLFRNHLNVSRELKTMFRAYQQSAAVFDPAANPKLFNGTLCIIIKDVIESDVQAAALEFRQKFQGMVEEEGADNFISKLHRNQLKIIECYLHHLGLFADMKVPWPVIQDTKFYSSFSSQIVKPLNKTKETWSTAGEFVDTLKLLEAKLKASDWTSLDSSMTSQRIDRLRNILSIAVAHGASDSKGDEPLMDLESGTTITIDGEHPFDRMQLLSSDGSATLSFGRLYQQFVLAEPRSTSDSEWRDRFLDAITTALERRIALVDLWAQRNVRSLPQESSEVVQWRAEVKRTLEDLRKQYRFCTQTCKSCFLTCVQLRDHERDHDCSTDHKCDKMCEYGDDHLAVLQVVPGCNLRSEATKPKKATCAQPSFTLAARPVTSMSMDMGIDVAGGTSHILATSAETGPHALSRARFVLVFARRKITSTVRSPVQFIFAEHDCVQQCEKPGVCEIAAEPHSIQSSFQGAHSSFEYTKHTQIAKRLKCAKKIPAGKLEHIGQHLHSTSNDFHYCETKCPACQYYCNLPIGHTQAEHDTSHGSMTATRWAIPDGEEVDRDGRKFAQGEEGAPMLCSMFCQGQNRHTHIDFCRSVETACVPDAEHEHVDKAMAPFPERPKGELNLEIRSSSDFITHKTHWQRVNFKDPYPQTDQKEFELCDAQCPGEEHRGGGSVPANPSFCTLPMFHPPSYASATPPPGGYISRDGHAYTCRNPTLHQRAFHVIFVLDRSGSMSKKDRTPMRDAPTWQTIRRRHDNRFGAVLSACYSFWSSRHSVTASANRGAPRRDAYSIVLFNDRPFVVAENDYTSSPDDLLKLCLPMSAGGSTNFSAAIDEAQGLMSRHWSPERTPIVIFLSDGECSITDAQIYPICRQAAAQGKPLNLHTVSFGPDGQSMSLKRMADVGKEVYDGAPRDPLCPPGAGCSFSTALDTVQLASTFLGIADSLKKPRGSLVSF